MKKQKICKHAGKPFVMVLGKHCHCLHPDKKVSGKYGVESLREYPCNCWWFEPKEGE